MTIVCHTYYYKTILSLFIMPQNNSSDISLSSIIFSQNYLNHDADSRATRAGFHYDSEQIHKDSKNIYNRLKSIYEDSKFVSNVSNMLPYLPVVANERCGTWYIDPQERLPDSLSKTIPIWCCTINLAIKEYRDSKNNDARVISKSEFSLLQEELDEWDTEFHSLSSVISNSERSQIISLIQRFARDLITSGFDISSLSGRLKKPLRPLWFTPSSNMVDMGSERRQGYVYVQGSADDHEMWAMGLTPSLFWKHREVILDTNDPMECERKVKEIVDGHKASNSELLLSSVELIPHPFNFIGNTNVAIGNYKSANPLTCWENFDCIINCTPEPYSYSEPIPPSPHGNNYLRLSIPEGKKGQNELFASIPIALEFVGKPLEEKKRILIHCKQGIDRSVGIGLAVLVKYFDDEGKVPCDKFVKKLK
ncbi:17349_t:CDS:2 [Acaulospora colombiana]|uniref:17349_t:CDS:1 n=1 Tax=Acaulospora colombiana TaxID=27376 RepID=A0ACA9K8T7_9GLOM|nr:17349_t:CDS:2 [Acaulospora colombiana]